MATALTSDLTAILAQPAHLSTLEQLEALAASNRISETFRAGLRREITRAHAARRAHEARSGVRWSGMQDDPYRVRTARELAAEAERMESFRRSPRGRFLAALKDVEAVDPARGDRVRSHYNRTLANDEMPLDVPAVGTALTMLNAIGGDAARTAIDALAEMLIEHRKAA